MVKDECSTTNPKIESKKIQNSEKYWVVGFSHLTKSSQLTWVELFLPFTCNPLFYSFNGPNIKKHKTTWSKVTQLTKILRSAKAQIKVHNLWPSIVITYLLFQSYLALAILFAQSKPFSIHNILVPHNFVNIFLQYILSTYKGGFKIQILCKILLKTHTINVAHGGIKDTTYYQHDIVCLRVVPKPQDKLLIVFRSFLQ